MPSEISYLNQKAILMPYLGNDRKGQPKVGPAVEIPVAWKYGHSEVVDADGRVIAFDATAVVGLDVKPLSRMWLGTMDDWLGTGSNDVDAQIMEVKLFSKVPDLNGREFYRSVMLMRWHAKTPPPA